MNNLPHIGFIGSGNMARAILNGLIRSGFPATNLWSADPDPKQLQAVSDSTDIHRESNNTMIVKNCRVVILAVKPQLLHDVIAPLQKTIQKNSPLLISLAAGIPINSLSQWLAGYTRIIRTMPNTPAQVSQGVTALCAHPTVEETDIQLSERIFEAVGITCRIAQEKQMDLVTAISGSGPAYFFLMLEAMENAACQLGMDRALARMLILQTAVGSGELAKLSHLPPKVLKTQVTSKGGTTEQALLRFEASHFSQTVLDAITAAQQRAAELSAQFGDHA